MVKQSKIHLLGLLALFAGCVRAAEQDHNPNNVQYRISVIYTRQGTRFPDIARYFRSKSAADSVPWTKDGAASTTALAFSQLYAEVQSKRKIDIRCAVTEKQYPLMSPQPTRAEIEGWGIKLPLRYELTNRFVGYHSEGQIELVGEATDPSDDGNGLKEKHIYIGQRNTQEKQSKTHASTSWTTKNYLQAAGITLGCIGVLAVAWKWYKGR